ncbi:MAG: hypothetical protein ABSD39_19565 [Terriglobales bacterium]
MGSILLQSFLRDGLLKASETWVTVAQDMGDSRAPRTRPASEGQVEGARRHR